jgi:hypothetical protein
LFVVAHKLEDLHSQLADLVNQIGTLRWEFWRLARTATDTPTTGVQDTPATPMPRRSPGLIEAENSVLQLAESLKASTQPDASDAPSKDESLPPFSLDEIKAAYDRGWPGMALTMQQANLKHSQILKRKIARASQKATTGTAKRSSSERKRTTSRASK